MKQGQHKQLAIGMAFRSGAAVLQKSAAVLLLPIYTRYLSPADYGYATFYVLAITIVEIFVMQGLRSAVMKRVSFDFAGDSGQRAKEAYGTALLYVAGASVVAGLIALPFAGPLSNMLFDGPRRDLILLGGVFLVVDCILAILSTIFLTQQRYALLASISLVVFAGKVAGNLIWLLGLKAGYASMIYGGVVGNVLGILVAFPFARSSIAFRFRMDEYRALAKFGRPLIFTALGMMVFASIDRIMLKRLYSMEAVGLYGIGYQISQAADLLFLDPFRQTWPTVCYNIGRQSDAKAAFARYALRIWCGGLLLAAGVHLSAPYALQLLTSPKFLPAANVAGLLTLGGVLFTLNDVLKVGMNITGRTNLLPIRVVASALVNIILNLLLIPRYGMIGAALGTAGAFVFFNVFTIWVCRSFYPIPLDYRRLGAAALFAGVATAASFLIPPGLVVGLAGRAVLFSLLAFALSRVASVSIKSLVGAVWGKLRSRLRPKLRAGA